MKVLHYVCQKIGKLSSGHRTGKGQFSFQSQKGQLQRMFKLPYIELMSHASKEMLKILRARLQYMNSELSHVQAGFRKNRGTRGQIANIHWIMEKAREFQENIYFCFIDYVKSFDCVDQNKLWRILKDMGISDHLACLLRNLHTGKESTVRAGRGKTDWFQIGKGV